MGEGVGPLTTGATRDTLRQHNLAAVLSRVHVGGPQTRSALTSATGLNRSTIADLVGELSDRGLVEEGKPLATGSAGRPSPLVHPVTTNVVVAGVDIGSKWITAAIGGVGGGLLARRHVDCDNDERPYAETVAHVVDVVADLQAGLDHAPHLFGVGVAAPGVVRTADGFVHVAPNVAWRNRALGADLRGALGGQRVVVGNEAHLGCRAEHLRGAGMGVDDMLYVSSEIGVGGGAIIGGRLHVGADGYSGEIGHVPVRTDGPPTRCRCGATGCMEAETGELALLRLLGRPTRDALVARVLEAVAEADAGDAACRDALHEIGVRLGRGLAGLANLLNPRRIVLGGYFAAAFIHLQPAITAELQKQVLPPHLQDLVLVPSALPEPALVGAVEIGLESLLADPTLAPTNVAA